MEEKLGAPQQCPRCRQFNPSGLELPDECLFCTEKFKKQRNIYFCEDGIEEGTLPSNLPFTEWFPDSLISINIEYFESYEIEIRLDPYFVSGKDIEKTIENLEAEHKQFYMENNQWILFIMI